MDWYIWYIYLHEWLSSMASTGKYTSFMDGTVDGRNPAPVDMVNPNIYRVLQIPGGAGFLNHQQYGKTIR